MQEVKAGILFIIFTFFVKDGKKMWNLEEHARKKK
jgi:hypothetical protein